VSRLSETQRAYDKVVQLLDQEIRTRRGPTKDLERFRETLDGAFYLLGWAQFEYLVRQETEDRVKELARAQTIDGHAWSYVRENVKNIKVRLRLDLIFHSNPTVRAGLEKDYERRNGVAHDYKLIPREAKDISAWIESLEDLVERF
jgi:hypothetical protein